MYARRWVLAMAAVVALCGLALAHDDDDNAKQHGYRHGYVDGYHHGGEDRRDRAGYDYRGQDFERADRGYDRNMGDLDDFQKAYRKGYRDGYDDGYNGRDRRMQADDDYRGGWDRGRDYDDDDRGGWDRGGRDRNIPDVSRDAKWTSMEPKAIGYRDGVEVGLYDWINQRRYNPHDNHWYSDADHWYDQASTKRNFKSEYRRGFQVGYDEAFQSDRWHRIGGNGTFGEGFRRGAYFGFVDSNRAKPFNPQRIPDYQQRGGDPQYQDGFMQGYGWVFQIRGQR